MKKLILLIILAPVLLLSQPSFNVTDSNGNTWNSDDILEQEITIVINFFSPGWACSPSANSIELFTEAYNQYSSCNKLFFIQVSEWGSVATGEEYINIYGTTEIPSIVGDEGYELSWEWVNEYGLMWSHELWILRPDGSYIQDINGAWDLDQQVLIDELENEGFNACENTGVEEYQTVNHNKSTYDIMGRVISEPTKGFYIQNGNKYIKF